MKFNKEETIQTTQTNARARHSKLFPQNTQAVKIHTNLWAKTSTLAIIQVPIDVHKLSHSNTQQKRILNRVVFLVSCVSNGDFSVKKIQKSKKKHLNFWRMVSSSQYIRQTQKKTEMEIGWGKVRANNNSNTKQYRFTYGSSSSSSQCWGHSSLMKKKNKKPYTHPNTHKS